MVDPTHLIGQLELSRGSLSFIFSGGTFARQENGGMFRAPPVRLSWQFGVALGGRLPL